ncbi:MAG: hypothetical protein JW973_13200 [Bacteroidales bacterium]|nr:hypothetical protein [Bacteroidales bacterium]
MKKKILFSLPVMLLFIACEKDFSDNTDQLNTELEGWEPFMVHPVPDSQVDLYSTFEISVKTIGYSTMYAEKEENIWGTETMSQSTTVTFYAVVDSVYLTDVHSDPIPVDVVNYSDVKFVIRPLTSFAVNSGIALQIDYHYTSNHEKTGDVAGIDRTKEYSFSTVPSDTLSQRVVYCEYPLYRQYNFLQDEYNYGYIKTYVKPDFLLDKKLIVTITGIGTEESYASDVEYDDALGILKYPMPPLQNNAIYRIDYIMNKDGTLQKFYRSNYFKTSRFNSFSDKIGDVLEGEHRITSWFLPNNVVELSAGDYLLSEGELLDYYEQVLPSTVSDDLHNAEAYDFPKLVNVQLDTIRTDLNKYGYSLARNLGYSVNRPDEYIGYVPVNDILHFISCNKDYAGYPDIMLSDEEIENEVSRTYELSYYVLKTCLGTYVNEDLNYFKNQAYNDFERKDYTGVIAIMNINWSDAEFYSKKFYYYLRYRLPGINVVTFERSYEFGPKSQ